MSILLLFVIFFALVCSPMNQEWRNQYEAISVLQRASLPIPYRHCPMQQSNTTVLSVSPIPFNGSVTPIPSIISTAPVPFNFSTTPSPSIISITSIPSFFSSKGITKSRRRIHTPQKTYEGLEYPHDHVSEPELRNRLQVLLPKEQAVISAYSKSHSYRRQFYMHCLDSYIPISTKGNRTFLKSHRDSVYLGVNRSAQNDCDGCLLRTPIHYRYSRNRIRKFVGNREVYDIITDENGISLFVLQP